MIQGCKLESGFDCSGFIRYLLIETGLLDSSSVLRHASEFFDDYGIYVQIPLPGDLIFFSRNGIWPHHLGLYIGGSSYVHAIGKNDSIVDVGSFQTIEIPKLNTSHDQNGNKIRQIYRVNPIGFKSPTYPVSNSQRWGRHA